MGNAMIMAQFDCKLKGQADAEVRVQIRFPSCYEKNVMNIKCSLGSHSFNNHHKCWFCGTIDKSKAKGKGERALVWAVVDKDPGAVQAWIRAGADVNEKNVWNGEGGTTIMVAAAYRQQRCVDLLIAAGAEVNVADNHGFAPLHHAAGINCEADAHYESLKSMVKSLITAGANINARDNEGATPLMFAVKRIRPYSVLVLLQAGTDPNLRDPNGETALAMAYDRATWSEIIRFHERENQLVIQFLERVGAKK
jgi:hypothetical protein